MPLTPDAVSHLQAAGHDAANLGEELHLQPRPLGPVPLDRLGQLYTRLWREAESTQRRESRL